MEYIAGVDEAGRGPLAGPVIAAAVILVEPIQGLNDSKLLSEKKRKALVIEIESKALAFALGRAEVEEIDRLNIHHATLLAMQRAVMSLAVQPDEIFVDGVFVPDVSMKATAIIGGDRLNPAISAASILAKVARDEEMFQLDALYPGYGFAAHKGYGTEVHREALQVLGPCPIHRRSFRPVADLLVQAVE